MRIDAAFLDQLMTARLWDGTPVPRGLQDRVKSVWAQFQGLDAQLREVKAMRAAQQRDLAKPTERAITQLQTLRAIGPVGAWVLATEIFGWRQIRNGRQVGALVGLVPAPYKGAKPSTTKGLRGRATRTSVG